MEFDMVLFNKVLVDWDGDNLREPDMKAEVQPNEQRPTRDLTLGTVCAAALNSMPQRDHHSNPNIEEMFKRAELIKKIKEAEKVKEEVKLSAEEIVLIKDNVARVGYSPWVVMQVKNLIDS